MKTNKTQIDFGKLQENLSSAEPHRIYPWLMMIGGLFLVIIAYTTGYHPNPFLVPSLFVIGFDAIMVGAALKIRAQRPLFSIWLLSLCMILFLFFLYLVLRMTMFA